LVLHLSLEFLLLVSTSSGHLRSMFFHYSASINLSQGHPISDTTTTIGVEASAVR
jgi:hypothetical protein